MEHHNRFQNQSFAGVQAQPSNSNQSNQGDSVSDQSPPGFEESIQTSRNPAPVSDPVAALAYQIYLQEGRPQGRAVQHWAEAEAQLAAIPPATVTTELTVKTALTVRNEIGLIPKKDQRVARFVQRQSSAN